MKIMPMLYLIEILHQTTTVAGEDIAAGELYLIEILHQTTTFIADDWPILSCILSKFYIKPQQEQWSNSYQNVVSYRNSTSNHNGFGIRHVRRPVVSYRNSTSNHNGGSRYSDWLEVVSYRNSTSNHNPNFSIEFFDKLYLIEILHQTTTRVPPLPIPLLLYLIEILHQTTTKIHGALGVP